MRTWKAGHGVRHELPGCCHYRTGTGGHRHGLDVADVGIGLGQTSTQKEVTPGLDHVLLVAAYGDATCAAENCLPIASKNEEEVVSGQQRTIALNMPNHQGPCPPEGVAPIP